MPFERQEPTALQSKHHVCQLDSVCCGNILINFRHSVCQKKVQIQNLQFKAH